MSEKSNKTLKVAIKAAYDNKAKATTIDALNESMAKQLSSAVSAYVTEELKAAGIQYNGTELPANVVRKGDLDGTAKIALNSLSAKKAITADTATLATTATTATYATRAGSATTATTALTASYVSLIAGPNITINTNSNGGIAITGSAGGGGSSPEYWTSLVNNNIFTTGSAVIRNGLIVTGSIYASHGFSGSLTRLESGKSYLVAGPNITINTASNGSVEITGSAGSGGGGSLQQAYDAGPGSILVNNSTGSLVISGGMSFGNRWLPLISVQPGFGGVTGDTNAFEVVGGNAGTNLPVVCIKSTEGDRFGGGELVFRSNGSTAGAITWVVGTAAGDLMNTVATSKVYHDDSIPALVLQTTNAGKKIMIKDAGGLAAGAIAEFVNATTSLGGTVNLLPNKANGIVTNSGSLEQAGLSRFLSNVTVTGSVTATTGFSGSLTRLKDGSKYLVAGPNITINTASNGSVEISGSAGSLTPPNIGWITAYEIDFATLSNLNLTGSSGATIGGIQFNVSNGSNANWVGPSASLGFAINSKATSTELWDNVRTAPLINIVMTDIVPGYHPDDYDIRVWAQVTHNASANSENYFLGYERYPIITPYERIYASRGYNSLQTSNLDVCYNNITAQSTNITSVDELADNTQVVTLDKWTSATHYQSSGSIGTFPTSSSLKLLQYGQMGLYSDTRFTSSPITGSNISVMFGAKTSNTAGTYSVVYRNLRVEYRRRGGGTYVTGSFISTGTNYWQSISTGNVFTTGSVDVTGSLIVHAGNITVTGSIISTAGFFGPVADRSSTVVTYSINPVTDQIIRVATTASNTVLQLPNPSCSGSFLIKKTVTGSYTIALSASIGEKIEDANGLYTLSGSALTTRPAWQVWSDGTNWWIA